MNNTRLLAFVGMPGSGKSSVVAYVAKKGIPVVRFGDVVEQELQTRNLPITPENEQTVREELRKEFGMDVFAKRSLPAIEKFQEAHMLGIDGLYSWEEYLLLQQSYPTMILIHVFAEKRLRYQRLSTRSVRPLTTEEAEKRDIAEVTQLNKGGPIALADYLLNNNNGLDDLYSQIDQLLQKISL